MIESIFLYFVCGIVFSFPLAAYLHIEYTDLEEALAIGFLATLIWPVAIPIVVIVIPVLIVLAVHRLFKVYYRVYNKYSDKIKEYVDSEE